MLKRHGVGSIRTVPVSAFLQACTSAASVVDFDPRHEVILLCSAGGGEEAAALAETLLALGFDVLVLSGTPPELAAGLEGYGQGARPALLVETDSNAVGPVLRSRVARVLSRPYCWLEGEPAAGALELQHRICARMDGFERELAQDHSVAPVDVEEVSNVVLLPVPPRRAPKPAKPARQRKKLSRLQLVVWPLAGAAVTAVGLALVGSPDSDPPPPPPPPEPAQRGPVAVAVAPPPPVEVEPMRPAPVAPPSPTPTAVVSPAAVAAPVEAEPLDDIVDNEHVIATDEWLVYEAPARARDWFAAMDLCRGRTLAGVDGWSTPSSKQLNTLAKARVLPEGSLWSRTRAMRADDVAFVVHGRAGTVRSAIKTETIDSAVCVRRRSPSP